MSNLIDLSKSIVKNVQNIDELIDSYFDPIKDVTETATDIFTPLKAVHSLYTFSKKRKFKKFLKSYSLALNPETFNLKSTERLKKYLQNEKNFNFLNSIIENAINSKSEFCSVVLGHYAAQILSNEQEITFKEILIIEGLKELNDYEISCFVKIYNVADLSKMINFSQLNLSQPKVTLELTIEKLIQMRWIEKDYNIYIGLNRNHNFNSTEIAEEVFFIIKDSEIYDDLLKY